MQSLAAFVLLAGLALVQAHSIRGLNPDLASHYSGEGGKFTCVSGIRKTIAFSRVNDDYCDCPDGSDEPGTSACHNGRFYCRNLGHEPRLLASAFVDDGVCDCCDGTDEPKGKCKNTCLEAAAVKKEELRGKIQLHEVMLSTKKAYAERASTFKEELSLKSQTIDDDIAKQAADVENLKAEVSRLEAEEATRQAEEAARQAEVAAANQAAEEERKAAATKQASTEGDQATSDGDGSSSGQAEGAAYEDEQDDAEHADGHEAADDREETPEERGRRIASQWTSDPEAAAVSEHVSDDEDDMVEDDGHYDNGGDDLEGHFDYPSQDEVAPPAEEHHHVRRPPRPEGSSEAVERSPPSEWEDLMMFLNLVKEWAARWIRTLSKILSEGIRDDVLAYRAKLKERNLARLRRREEKPVRARPSHRHSAGAADGNGAAAADATDPNSPLGKARTAVFQAERQLERLQKDKENIGTFLHSSLDFGPNDVFLALANKCFTSYQTRWTYEVCIFDKATQKEGYTNAVTVGRWYGFSPDYKTMYFTGGDECWNVGPRSMTVSLYCGWDEKLSDGEEPSTCAYSAKLSTPAVCTEAELQELKQQMDSLEAFEKEVQAQILKDEL